MRTEPEPVAQWLWRHAKAVVLVALLAAGLGALVVAARPDDGPPRPTFGDCEPSPAGYVTATASPWRPTPGPGTPWPTVVTYAYCL